MPPKGKGGAKAAEHRGAELKVAKRGTGKPGASQSQRTTSSDRAKDTSAKPAGETGPEGAPRVSSRKVSDGLKQLPQAAYTFVRESYLMLDSEGTGSVSKATMRDMLASLGLRDDGDRRLNAMLERTGEPITFASYLAVMGELLGDLPAREELDMMLEAFQRKDGSVDERDLRDALAEEGLTSEELETVMKRFSKPTRQGQTFDVKKFASAMSV